MPVGNPSPTHTSGSFVLRPWAYLQAGTPAVSMARVSIDFGRKGLCKIPSSPKFLDQAGDQGGFCPCPNRSRRSRCPGNLDMPTFNGLRRTGYVRSGPLVPRDFPPEDEYGMGCLGKIRARCDVGTAARKSKSSSEPDTKWTTPPSGVANQAPSRLSAYLGPGVVPGRLNASVRMECLLTQYSQLDQDWR